MHTADFDQIALGVACQRRGLPMAVASGGSREHVLGGIRACGLESMFQAYVCCEVGLHAPQPGQAGVPTLVQRHHPYQLLKQLSARP